MSVDGLTRVQYFDEQFLRLADLVDEQAYHLLMRRRHNLGGHTWGIVAGLMVESDRDGNLVVQPGMAVDGYGRELILPYPYSLPPRAFAEKGSNELEVWLVYTRQPADSLPAGYAPCRPGETGPAGRLLEMGQIELRASERDLFIDPTVDLPARRQPPGVPAEDLRAVPAPNDDLTRPWPVYLGLVRRVEGDPVTYTVDLQGRPYAGLVGEMVRAPSGRAWVQIGAEREGDTRRFAVFVPGSDADIEYPPRLAIHDNGEVTICGDTTLYGDLTVDGGAIEFRVGDAQTAAQPWTIYHARANSGPEQLRMEMADEAAEVVIGTFSSTTNAFVPCLTIDSECKVTIHGNLFVEGTLTGKVVDSGTLTPEARSMALGAMNSGMNTGLQRAAEAAMKGKGIIDLESLGFGPGLEAAGEPQGLVEELVAFARRNNLTAAILEKLRGEVAPEAPAAPPEEETSAPGAGTGATAEAPPAAPEAPAAPPEEETPPAAPLEEAAPPGEGASAVLDVTAALPPPAPEVPAAPAEAPSEGETPAEEPPAARPSRSRSRRKKTGKPSGADEPAESEGPPGGGGE
jgi:hypothetical protein